MAVNPGAEAFPVSVGAERCWPNPSLTLHRFFPAAAFYFFLNAAGLPNGLYFTTLLAPLLYVWLYLEGQRRLTLKFLLAYSPFLIAHLINGISSPLYYFRSLLLLWTVFVATYAICWALSKTATAARLFDQLIAVNFFSAVFACLTLPTPLRSVLWVHDTSTFSGGSALLRLNLLSVEPSEYALLMLPLLLFASLRLFQKTNVRSFLYLLMVGIPFLLSQSFGGISIGLAAVGISLIVTNPRLFKRAGSLTAIIFCMVVVIGLLVIHNPISERVLQVVSGNDSSTRARTFFSFVAAYAIASAKSLIWGAGLGQAKLTDFSSLHIGFETNAIPNSIASLFAELGIVGALAKLVAEGWLFFKTRVYRDTFRLACFIVGFIFQFSGGFLMNVQEYILWFLTFYPSLVMLTPPRLSKTENAVQASRN